MEYLLVENKQTVHLGPTIWKPRYIQSEINDQELVFTIPITEPSSYLKIDDSFEIFPVGEVQTPSFNALFESLSGPFWSFNDNVATGFYNVVDNDLEFCKQIIKQKIATKRYEKEVAGIKVNIGGQEYTLETDRDTRNIFVQKIILMGDTDTANWKFPEGWVLLDKQTLGNIITQGALYIQQQFDWETNIASLVDSTTTLAQLKHLYNKEIL